MQRKPQSAWLSLPAAIGFLLSIGVSLAHADTFSAPGPYSYTVPAGVTQIQVVLAGGGGGGGFL